MLGLCASERDPPISYHRMPAACDTTPVMECNQEMQLCAAGSFDQLQTLDLCRCFAASTQESIEKNEAASASIIRGTGGRLRRLRIDDGCAGADVVEAIASKGSRLEQLAICDCRGLTDAGLQALAAACKQLARLRVGGDSRCLHTA